MSSYCFFDCLPMAVEEMPGVAGERRGRRAQKPEGRSIRQELHNRQRRKDCRLATRLQPVPLRVPAEACV